jgi:hypothetical protein
MKIYIASSWKNQHAVEMLTALLREADHEVISWIENNYGENPNNSGNSQAKKFDFEEWVNSPEADQSFAFDTIGAATCDLLIYVGPAGKDAAAEVGIAYARNIRIIGLWSKGEDFGLMRKMFHKWFERYTDLLIEVDDYSKFVITDINFRVR